MSNPQGPYYNILHELHPTDVNGEPLNIDDYVLTSLLGENNQILLKITEILNNFSVFAYNPPYAQKPQLHSVRYITKIPHNHPIYTYPEEWVTELYELTQNVEEEETK